MGTSDQDQVNYSKSSALHLHLLGYEFPDTIMVLMKNQFYVMAHPKKCGYIERAAGEKPDSFIKVTCLPKGKDEALNKENFAKLIEAMRTNGENQRVGTLLKDNFNGNFIASWQQALTSSDLATSECSAALGRLLSVKDETEMESCRRAAALSNKVEFHHNGIG